MTGARRISSWILAARLKTLPAAVAPVLVGAAVAHAHDGFALWPVLLAAAGAVWIQIGTNFANDAFDFERGADDETRVGPTRAVQAGLLTSFDMKVGMGVAFALAALCGLALVRVAGWPVVAIGVASLLSGYAYTGGPFPLGYHGLGDVFVFVFFGLVAVLGTVYVQLLHLTALAWWSALPVGALATAILVVNNLRDRDTDAVAGKRTLAVRWGARAVRAEYLTLLAVAYVVPVALAAVDGAPLRLLPLVTLPLAARVASAVVSRDDGPTLNQALARTAGLLLVHSGLWALGLAW